MKYLIYREVIGERVGSKIKLYYTKEGDWFAFKKYAKEYDINPVTQMLVLRISGMDVRIEGV